MRGRPVTQHPRGKVVEVSNPPMDQGFGILQAVLPWERQPGEGPKPWQAFQMYLTIGRDRSAMAVAAVGEK